ncbi:hypothetical protein, partial [Novipirellula rosea]|uniref:hypothetical protein n=1 Tax=Novipirellula rosea TaxID=1031540 RepID=UPI0031EAF217
MQNSTKPKLLTHHHKPNIGDFEEMLASVFERANAYVQSADYQCVYLNGIAHEKLTVDRKMSDFSDRR